MITYVFSCDVIWIAGVNKEVWPHDHSYQDGSSNCEDSRYDTINKKPKIIHYLPPVRTVVAPLAPQVIEYLIATPPKEPTWKLLGDKLGGVNSLPALTVRAAMRESWRRSVGSLPRLDGQRCSQGNRRLDRDSVRSE